MPGKVHPDIWRAVESVPVIDTHEHFEEESTRLDRPGIDFATLFEQYAADDFRSAGMDDDTYRICFDPETSLSDKWMLFEPFYQSSRNTAYCKAVEIAIRDLYGIDALNEKTIHTLSERIAERNKPGVLKWILRDRCNIEHAMINAIDTTFIRRETDRNLFSQDLSVAHLLNWPIRFADLQSETGVSIRNLDSYGKAIDRLFFLLGRDAVAVKQQSAYWRPQQFKDVPDNQAASILMRAIGDPDSISVEDQHALQDWSFHRCIRNAIQHDLPIKIHTGYKVGVNYMRMNDIRPVHLESLFIQYPEAKFVLFHIGYPFQDEVIALAKHYSNVFVDMCWAWIIDPVASGQFLKRCLTAVPASKLMAFGGDYIIAEPVYGHLKIARKHIARTLTELVEDESLALAEATEMPRRILRENALRLFPRCKQNGSL